MPPTNSDHSTSSVQSEAASSGRPPAAPRRPRPQPSPALAPQDPRLPGPGRKERVSPLPTDGEPRPYLDGPQPRVLGLEGHDLGRVGDVEQHVEALVLLQDPPCGSPGLLSAPHAPGVTEAPPRSQEPLALQTPAPGFPGKLTGGLWRCSASAAFCTPPSPLPRCGTRPASSWGLGTSSEHRGARWPGPNHIDPGSP